MDRALWDGKNSSEDSIRRLHLIVKTEIISVRGLLVLCTRVRHSNLNGAKAKDGAVRLQEHKQEVHVCWSVPKKSKAFGGVKNPNHPIKESDRCDRQTKRLVAFLENRSRFCNVIRFMCSR